VNDLKYLTLDANILYRAVFGDRVSTLIQRYSASTMLVTPDICFDDARRGIPDVAAKRHSSVANALLSLDRLEDLIHIVHRSDYGAYEEPASDRIRSRDITDWPIVATSLLLNAPLWTEDQDFFGCGIATWTTVNVELYLRAPIAS
jgi:predicted nucleic acid-binding protein